jgi:peptidoglycan/xylan/chitin deacetylase (PgdA/CDA1 family)
MKGKPRFHGLMFHHFHNNYHPKGQGSISSETFENILKFYSKKYNIISSDIFYKRFMEQNLEDTDVCITFDDNLKCQYDIALPILDKYSLKAFWFVYTSPLNGVYEKLEVYRYFRSKFFKSFKEFYDLFFQFLKNKTEFLYVFELLDNFDHREYLNEFSFYSKEDKIFRYTRDKILGEEKYFNLMDCIIKESGLKLNDDLHKCLWMDKIDLKDLSEKGHIVGLHSHSHPTTMGEKSFDFQNKNYKINKSILEDVLKKDVFSMSHPCNSYNNDTLEILTNLNIEIGFRANMRSGFNSNLEVPRIDHSEIVKFL